VSTSSLRDLLRLVGAEKFPAEFTSRGQSVRKCYVAVQAKVARSSKLESAGCIVGGWARDPKVDPWNVTRADSRPTFVDHYTKDARLFGLFGFLLGLYFILPPWEVSAGEAIYSFQMMVRDNNLSYPKGGAAAIPRALVRALEKFGGSLRTRAAVESLEKTPAGWRIGLGDGGELRAKSVVSTSSLRDLLRMVGAEKFPAEFTSRVQSVRKSYVAVQAKVARSSKLESAGCIVGGWARDPKFDPWNVTRADYRQTFVDLDAGRVPSVVPVYCPIPTNFDPSLGPGQLLTACAVAPCTDTPRPEDKKPNARNDSAFIDGLLKAMDSLMPGVFDGALFVDTMGTEALASWIGKAGGPAVSTGQTPDQVGKKRPSVRTPLSGLYVCGDGAGGRGIGTELAAASGMECVDAVLADLEGVSSERAEARAKT
jgi:prolycopene isomerase